jgi:hypothetical protein
MKTTPTHPALLALLALPLLAALPSTPPDPAEADSVLTGAPAQEPAERDVSHFNLGKDGLAIEGFDPVGYFPEGGGKPMKGLPELELVHRGVRYHFASKDNRERFEKDPDRFEPAYGGWCAFAMAEGEKIEVDPKSFHIDDDGNLFLFFKSFFNDTRKKWLKEEQALERKADAAWAKILRTR